MSSKHLYCKVPAVNFTESSWSCPLLSFSRCPSPSSSPSPSPSPSGDSGVWGLKKNFALLELLERLQNGASNQSGMSEEALREMGEVRTWDLHPRFVFYKNYESLAHDQTLSISNTSHSYHSPLLNHSSGTSGQMEPELLYSIGVTSW